MPSSAPVNDFNRIMQTNGVKDQWLRANGIDPSRPIKLSDAQRMAFQRYLESQGAVFPDGVEIDPAGNMNENEGFGKQLKKWGPLAAAAAVSLFGIPGTPIAGLLGGGSAGAAASAGGAAEGGVTVAPGAVVGPASAAGGAGGLGGTLLRYGLQYGVPVAGSLIAGKMAANAERDSNAALMGYYDRALDDAREERTYNRGWDEEGRRYDRYKDTFGTLSDEEKLAYDRSQSIRDKNYGYQQYGNFVETLEPFRASGAAATSRMSGLIGGPTPAPTGSYGTLAQQARSSVQPLPPVPERPTWSYGATAESPGPGAPVNTTQPVGGGSGVVVMESPDGERRSVSAEMAASLARLGARRIG